MAVIAPDGTRQKQKTRAPARPPSSSETRYAVPALDKGLDVLELLAREPGGLTLNEVARALGRTSSELFRMVTALARRGYIEQGDGDRYTLTLKLFELAHRHKGSGSSLKEGDHLAERPQCNGSGAEATVIAEVIGRQVDELPRMHE